MLQMNAHKSTWWMRAVFFVGYIFICAVVKVIAYVTHIEAASVVAAIEFVVFTFYKANNIVTVLLPETFLDINKTQNSKIEGFSLSEEWVAEWFSYVQSG